MHIPGGVGTFPRTDSRRITIRLVTAAAAAATAAAAAGRGQRHLGIHGESHVGHINLDALDLRHQVGVALTEAAVGAGITGILFFLTLRRIDRIDRDADVEETQGEEEPHEENEATH